MKVGDLVRHKQFPKTIGLIVETFESRRQFSCKMLWTIKPWFVNETNQNDLWESHELLEVINEDR